MGFWLRKTIVSAPVLSGSFADAYFGQAYSSSLTITGGAPPYTYTLVSGTLPDGLTLAVDGGFLRLTGTPTNGGTAAGFTFSVKVTGSNLVDSNTVATSGMVVHMWSAPSVGALWGKRSRVGYGATICGYLGTADTSTAFTDAVTITSGNASGHWKLQNRTMGTSSASALYAQQVGLAPANSGAGSYRDQWAGGSPSDSYTLVLTHTATGQTCTVNVSTDFSYEWNDRTYTSANCVSVATAYDIRNQATGANPVNSYLDRNATEGGLVLLRNGANFCGEAPTYANFFIGGGAYANAGSFTRGTWDREAATFAATHGDGISPRQAEGWNGGNYTLFRPESDMGATFTGPNLTLQGVVIAEAIFEAPTNAYGCRPRATTDIVIDCCRYIPRTGATNATGISAVNTSPWPSYVTVINCEFDGVHDSYVGYLINPYVAGNLFRRTGQDGIRLSVDAGGANFPVGGTVDGDIYRNVFIDQAVTGGAHPDAIQYYLTGTTGVGGTLNVEKNLCGWTDSQEVFNGGGTDTTTQLSANDRWNIVITAKAPNQHTWYDQANYVGSFNTVLWDYNAPDFTVGNVPGFVAFGQGLSTNVTIQNNIANRFDTPTVTGTLTMGATTNTNPGDNAIVAANATAYGNAYVTPMPVGGFAAATAGIDNYVDAAEAILTHAIPKDALAGAGGLKRAGGTGPGALTPAATVSAPVYNSAASW